jgi:hypothetical protein
MALIALRLCRLDFTEALRRELSRLEQCLGVGVGVAAPLLVDARASATRGQPARWWPGESPLGGCVAGYGTAREVVDEERDYGRSNVDAR